MQLVKARRETKALLRWARKVQLWASKSLSVMSPMSS
jgi:hypothetical protein